MSGMDYKGQELCEYIYYRITILFGVVAWIVGYINADFTLTFKGWLAGLILSLVICIPDWPIFNRNKVIWLEEIGQSPAPSSNNSSVSKQSKPKKEKKSKKDKESNSE